MRIPHKDLHKCARERLGKSGTGVHWNINVFVGQVMLLLIPPKIPHIMHRFILEDLYMVDALLQPTETSHHIRIGKFGPQVL